MARALFVLLALAALLATAAAPADGRIYWANRGGSTVGSAYLDGSSATQDFITGANGVNAAAADEQHVFWGEETSNRVGWANADGTNVDHAIIASFHAYGLAVRGTKIFYGSGANIVRATLNAPVTDIENPFITGVGVTYGLAADSGHLYWPDEFNNRIGRANLDGTGAEYSFISGASVSSPLGVAVDSSHIYWDSPAGIARADLDGTNVNASFIALSSSPWGLAVDRKHIYWTDGNTNVGRANLDGTGVNESFITGGSTTFGIAVNGAPRDTGGSVTMTGTAQVGQQLTCDRSAWNVQGDPMTYTYAWLREGSAIGGATAATYTPVAADGATNVACRVTASNDGGDVSTTSASAYVPAPPTSASAPAISGTIEVGQQVTCSTGAWNGDTPLTYAYQWLRGGFPIDGSISATYVLTSLDVTQTLTCRVQATGPGGTATATSAGVVVPEPATQATPPRNVQLPAVSGIAAEGSVLTCAPGAWTGATAYSYAWLRDGNIISGAGGAAYTATAMDVGHQVACRVTAGGAAGTTNADSLGVLIAAATDNLTPRLTGLSLTPTVFRAAARGASIAIHTVTGSRVRYTLSKSATVRFTVARRNTSGRYVALKGSFRRASTAGPNRFRFTGRLARRRLDPGRYRLRARPRDSAGRRGATRRVAFRIVRRVTARAARERTYRGTTSQGKRVKLRIDSALGRRKTWWTYLEFGYSNCAGAGSWVVSGGDQMEPDGTFQYRHVVRKPGYYTEIKVVRGRMEGWNAARRTWRKATGTYRHYYNQVAGSEEDPPRSCDATVRWTARRPAR